MRPLSTKMFSERLFLLLPELMRGLMSLHSDELTHGEITLPQFILLNLIYKKGSLKMTEISLHLHSSLPAVSGLVDRLVSLKFLKRHYDKKDRRIIRIGLSPKGKKMVIRIQAQRIRLMSTVFSKLSMKDRNDYLRILTKVVKLVASKGTRS